MRASVFVRLALMIGVRLVLMIGVELAVAGPAPAYAQSSAAAGPAADRPLPAAVRLIQEPCALYDAHELPSLLRVELAALGISRLLVDETATDAAQLENDLAVLRIVCAESPDTVTVQLADMITGKTLQRSVLVAAVEMKARSRLLAMTAAGLIESSWTELAITPHTGAIALPEAITTALRHRLRSALQIGVLRPSAVTPRTTPRETPRDTPRAIPIAPRSRSSLQLAGVIRSFPARQTGLAGLAVTYGFRASPGLQLWGDLEAQLGGHELNDAIGRIGSMRLYWLTGGVGIEWVSATLPELSVGPFLRAGYALASAESEREGVVADSVGGAVSALGLRTELLAPLSRSWAAFFALEGGYMPHGVVFLSDRDRTTGMAEVALAMRIGIALTSFE